MFTFFYYFLALLAHILAIPYLLYKATKQKYKDAIPAKFFLRTNPPFEEDKIWFHSCSMGETKALKLLIESFDKKDINLSVITNTGYEVAKGYDVETRYLPFETLLPFWIKKQKFLIVMEAELWYMLFLLANNNGTKTLLINARISDKSYKNYKKFSWFYKKIFANIDKIFAQSQLDKERLFELGAKDIEVIGNIKLAAIPKISKKLDKPDKSIITAASTHEDEEKLILDAWKKEQGKLIIVPRHPERFAKVDHLIQKFIKESDISYHKWSNKEDFTSDIILVDSMGELNNIYAISDVVILGGSFIKSAGGHNPIEPAFFEVKLLSGKTIFNQKALFDAVENSYLIDKDELEKYLDDIKNLKSSKLKNIGSIDPIIKYIKENQ